MNDDPIFEYTQTSPKTHDADLLHELVRKGVDPSFYEMARLKPTANNHNAIAILYELAQQKAHFNLTPRQEKIFLWMYVKRLNETRLGIDTDNVGELDQEPVKE